MDDLISRHAAINVIERNRAYIGHNMERAVGAAFIEILNCVGEDIGRLPSIQLATDTNVGAKLGTDLAQLGTDCISRQQAIKTVGWYSCHSGDELLFADNALRQLPPIQPKRGRWERGFDGNHAVCSNCQAWWIPFGEGYKTDYHFCPNCGADMRGERDG